MRFAVAFSLALLLAAPVLGEPIVKTGGGALAGLSANGVTSFKGIPYAAPPVGDLRWRPPASPARWRGLREAKDFGPICMQKTAKDNGVGSGGPSEDCLTLNVFTASLATRAPVMVWIHGGSFVGGSGSAALYDGAALARQGVVVVILNYRLGRLGFFALPALAAEQKGGPLANYGLMDQIAALRWVRRNIASFGGDPEKVTIFGESSGGTSVVRLMMVKAARGLFRRAIVESGNGLERTQTLAEAEADGAAFAARLGASDLRGLRALPAQKLIAGGLDLLKGEAPIVDGVFLKENPDEAFVAGRIAHVPFMVGSNSLELPSAWLGAFKKLVTAPIPPERRAALVQAYGSDAGFNDHIVPDVIFGAPARAQAAAAAKEGLPTYLYRFDVVADAAPRVGGAVHASERQYVFDNLSASLWPTGPRDEAAARQMSAYWVAFAKTGDPNGGGRPAWPRYDVRDQLMLFANDGARAETTPDAAALNLIAADLRGRPSQ